MALKKDLINKLVDLYGYEKPEIEKLTNAKLQELIDNEEKDAEELADKKKSSVKKVKQFDANDEITVMNGTLGALTHRSGLDGRSWRFTEFGQLDTMPYRELLAIKNGVPKMISEGTIVIMNEDVQEIFNIKELYKNILTPDNATKVFSKNVDELEEFINNLPESMRQTFLQKAVELYSKDKIHDLRIIKLIESRFNVSLEDNAPINEAPLRYD